MPSSKNPHYFSLGNNTTTFKHCVPIKNENKTLKSSTKMLYNIIKTESF